MEEKVIEQPARTGGDVLTIEGEAVFAVKATKDEEAGENDKPCMAKFTMTANTGSPMRLSGWKYPVVLDLEGIQIRSQKSPIRMGHDPMMGVGHTESIGVVNGKLVASGVISRSTDAARDVKESAKNGFPWQASVGASADDVEFVKDGQTAAANGRTYEGPVNIARKSTLGEISFVDMGADPHTDALIAERKIAAMAKDGETAVIETDDPSQEAQRILDRVKAKRARERGIAALAEEYGTLTGANLDEISRITAQAQEEEWDLQKVELACLRATRPKAPQRAQGEPATPAVIEASLCMACGVSDESLSRDRDYGPDVVAKAWPLRNRGLRGTICAVLEANGQRVPHGSKEFYAAIVESQSGRSIQAAGFSTVNLPGVLGNVANKVLLEAFTKVDATYDRLADQADFSNFHIHSIYRLGANGDFALVKPDGEIQHGTLEQDGAFINKLDTYGRMLTITRQDIINDDLNAFRSLTVQLARRARLAVEKALYALVAEGSNVFYTTVRGNLLATTPLDIQGLGTAEAALIGMVDSNNDPIYATPRFLVVPATLKYFADQIFTSQLVNDFTTGKARPTDNPFRGRFEVIYSPFLNSSTITGNSTSTWYLVADPLMLPAWQVAYLDGRRAPTIETSESVFNTLGLQMRCYWDFGVGQLDYRGAIKCTA